MSQCEKVILIKNDTYPSSNLVLGFFICILVGACLVCKSAFCFVGRLICLILVNLIKKNMRLKKKNIYIILQF